MNTAARMTGVPETQFTVEEFQLAGGLKGAINEQAEKVLARFPEDEVAISRLFQRLTDQGEGEKPVRRPETLRALEGVTGLSQARLGKIVGAFVEDGLLVKRTLENGEVEVDLPHECVAWKWERLKG